MKKVLAIILVIFVIGAFSACSPKQGDNEVLIASQKSPDGNYTVSFYQVGEPQWPFGPVGAKLILTDVNGNKLDEEIFDVLNDGAGAHEGNLKAITWDENEVQVLIDSEERPEEYHVLNYSGN